jgi:hypothetical protein
MVLERPETKRWTVGLDGDIAYREIISRTNVANMETTGKYLFKGKVATVTAVKAHRGVTGRASHVF